LKWTQWMIATMY